MELKIRKVDPYVMKRLDEDARKKSISREELIRRILNDYAVRPDIRDMNDKYAALVRDVIEEIGRLRKTEQLLEAALNGVDA